MENQNEKPETAKNKILVTHSSDLETVNLDEAYLSSGNLNHNFFGGETLQTVLDYVVDNREKEARNGEEIQKYAEALQILARFEIAHLIEKRAEEKARAKKTPQEIAARELDDAFARQNGERIAEQLAETMLNAELIFEDSVKCREILIASNFATIREEINHFNKTGAVIARPLSFHLGELVKWNQQTEIARDAFRDELARLGYRENEIRELYEAKLASRKKRAEKGGGR
jgi:hypothetical protein